MNNKEQPTSPSIDKMAELEEPIGKFILSNADGTQTPNGMYYHYVQVCHLLNTQKKANNHLDELEKYIESELTDWSDRDASERLSSDYSRAMINSCQDILHKIQELKTKQ